MCKRQGTTNRPYLDYRQWRMTMYSTSIEFRFTLTSACDYLSYVLLNSKQIEQLRINDIAFFVYVHGRSVKTPELKINIWFGSSYTGRQVCNLTGLEAAILIPKPRNITQLQALIPSVLEQFAACVTTLSKYRECWQQQVASATKGGG